MTPKILYAHIILGLSALFTMVFEYFEISLGLLIFKPLIILSLFAIYKLEMSIRYIWFEIALGLALLTNILFIYRESALALFLGILSTFLYIIIYCGFIMKRTKVKNAIPVAITSLPFVLFSVYEVSLFKDDIKGSLWLIWLTAVASCLFCGLSFYTFFLRNTRKTVYLAISGLGLFFMVVLFGLEVFFFSTNALRVPIIGSYVLCHYFFFRFLELSEIQPNKNEVEQFL